MKTLGKNNELGVWGQYKGRKLVCRGLSQPGTWGPGAVASRPLSEKRGGRPKNTRPKEKFSKLAIGPWVASWTHTLMVLKGPLPQKSCSKR